MQITKRNLRGEPRMPPNLASLILENCTIMVLEFRVSPSLRSNASRLWRISDAPSVFYQTSSDFDEVLPFHAETLRGASNRLLLMQHWALATEKAHDSFIASRVLPHRLPRPRHLVGYYWMQSPPSIGHAVICYAKRTMPPASV